MSRGTQEGVGQAQDVHAGRSAFHGRRQQGIPGPTVRRHRARRNVPLPVRRAPRSVGAEPTFHVADARFFFSRYFKRRATTRGLTEDDDVESVASDDFQEYLTQVGSMDFAADAKPKPKDKKVGLVWIHLTK